MQVFFLLFLPFFYILLNLLFVQGSQNHFEFSDSNKYNVISYGSEKGSGEPAILD